MIIRHNLNALNTLNNFNKANNKKSKAMEKLSSGLRINRAADDAAGLAISEKMRAQIRGLNQAERNIKDGISLIQTAEGALNETHSILQRMRELCVQAANDTLTKDDREKIQDEINQLKKGVDDIANNTEFNGIKLFDGTISGYKKVLSPTTEIQSPATNAKVILKVNIPNDFKVISGVNDKINIKINGNIQTIIIDDGIYDANNLINEINSKFAANIPEVNCLVSYSNGKLEFMNTIAGSSNTIENLSGDLINSLILTGHDGYVSSFEIHAFTTLDYRYYGTEYPYSYTYNDKLNIETGVNDELSFTIDGKKYNITIPAGNYSIFGDVTNSDPFMVNLNEALRKANAPVIAGYRFMHGTPKEANYGLTIYFKVTPNAGGIHKVGEFSGTAKSLIFSHYFTDKYSYNYALRPDSSEILEKSAIGYPAILVGAKNISQGININDSNNKLKLDVNGYTQEITLTNKSYSSSELLTELNSKLSGVIASYSYGKLALETINTGNSSTLSNISDSAFNTLFVDVESILGTDDVNGNVIEQIADPNKTLNFQIGSNSNNKINITIDEYTCKKLDIENDKLNITTQNGAERGIELINNAIYKVSSERSKIGAYQNALEHTLNNVANYKENLTASESRIRDADMAKEIMKFTKQSILEQTSQALLKQANQQPNRILELLT